jgi:hypothetical protein
MNKEEINEKVTIGHYSNNYNRYSIRRVLYRFIPIGDFNDYDLNRFVNHYNSRSPNDCGWYRHRYA